MHCMECDAPISPAFKAAIESNICPGCGGHIMNDDAQQLMSELKQAMEQMPNDPQGLAGWLMSNYRMQKVGDGEPTGFYGVRAPQPQQGPDRPDGIKLAPNKLQQFLKNAGIKPQDKDMGVLAAHIQAAGAVEGVDYGEPEFEVDEGEIPDEANFPEFTKAVLAGMTDKKMSPTQRAQMMRQASDHNNIGNEDLHPALQEDRKDRIRKQQKLISGGSIGKISRSE